MMLPILPPERWYATATLVIGWLALCAAIAWRERARRAREAAAARRLGTNDGPPPLLVAHASQTGTAESLAWLTAETLRAAGMPARIASLATLQPTDLATVERVLLVASTYGEGDPPDSAAPFASRVMARNDLNLAGLGYAILALGDRTYANFCGFGRALDDWLRDHGARPLFARIDVDNGDPAAIDDWRRRLVRLVGGGTDGAGPGGASPDGTDLDGAGPGFAELDAAWSGGPFGRWRLRNRRHLNPGSAGQPVFQLDLVPATPGPLPDWQAGDLLQIRLPIDPDRPRDYSIATVPGEGCIQLLVRLARRPDGSTGAASGWLAEGIGAGGEIDARIQPHPGFRLGDNASRPLLLIGNGTGIAGLRGLLKARADSAAGLADAARSPLSASGIAPRAAWLLFGERNAAHDAFYDDELTGWLRTGVLTRCDRVYSRDQPARRYVQHRLAEVIDEVGRWVAAGAAIYVCGSLQGMATGVDETLAAGLGRETLDDLIVAGRYRRDVY